MFNRKTTFKQLLSEFFGVAKLIVLLVTYQVKWICLKHCTTAVYHVNEIYLFKDLSNKLNLKVVLL